MAPLKRSKSPRVTGKEVAMRLSSTEESVRAWRRDGFAAMGFNKPMAMLLAKSRVDLHQAQRMIDQGCDHALLTAILLEDDEVPDGERVVKAVIEEVQEEEADA